MVTVLILTLSHHRQGHSSAAQLFTAHDAILHDTCKHTHAGIAQVFTWRRTQPNTGDAILAHHHNHHNRMQ
eukprot:834133-Amphidinium_carterae.2